MKTRMAVMVICGLCVLAFTDGAANTITLPGTYELSSSDIIVLNEASPQRIITYDVGILAGNEIDFLVRYINLDYLNTPFGDTVNDGGFRVYHHNDLLIEIGGIVAGVFAETTLSVGDLVENGNIEIRLELAPGSDPLEFYRPWLYITDDVPPAATANLAVTQIRRSALRLEWTAPGDDGLTGNATIYEIRYSKWPIVGDTAEWWGYAEQAAEVPYPLPTGSAESFLVTNLDTVSTYYFLLVAYDEVGNRSDYSNIASGTTGPDTGPGGNYCLDYNGINMRAVIPNNDVLNPTESITIEAWVSCRNFTRWTQGFILGKSYPEYRYPFSQYFLAVTSINSEYASITTADNVWHKLDTGPIELLPDEWTHLSFTYDGSELILYVNGQFNQSTPVSGAILTWPYDINIGILEYLNGWGFDGLIDEIRIWNIARSQGEIQQSMNSRLNGNEPGLVGYWNFDEGDGQEFFDITSHGSNGYLGSEPVSDANDPLWAESNCPVQELGTNTPDPNLVPGDITMLQNYPNPFNSDTKISFNLPQNSFVRLEIYDMLGRRVKTLFDGMAETGKHDIVWDGLSDSGETLSSGVYFYRLKTDKFDSTKRMLMVK